jgi:hypothetical protein
MTQLAPDNFKTKSEIRVVPNRTIAGDYGQQNLKTIPPYLVI